MASNVASHAITFFFFFSVISEKRTKFPQDVWPTDYERDRAALHMSVMHYGSSSHQHLLKNATQHYGWYHPERYYHVKAR